VGEGFGTRQLDEARRYTQYQKVGELAGKGKELVGVGEIVEERYPGRVETVILRYRAQSSFQCDVLRERGESSPCLREMDGKEDEVIMLLCVILRSFQR
jgi:hypothetical protein